MTQPALMTNSISSAIGMGGGTTGAQPNFTDGAGSTGRFTGGVRFSDPALQGAFYDPLTAEDYAGFMVGAGMPPPSTDGWGNVISAPDPAGYPPPMAPSAYNWGSYFASGQDKFTTDGTLTASARPNLRVYRGGAEISDPASLNERERRAYQALRDPGSANPFDLQSHPAYSTMRQSWYTSPHALGQKYGFTPKFEDLSSIENQYRSDSPGYIPMDFFAKSISDKLADSNASTYGNMALAVDTLDAWRQQPALGGQFSSVNDFPQLWHSASNSDVKQREHAYIAEEQTEDSGGGMFGGGFFGKLLSFAAPILSFVPGLQPLGWALGAMNAIANDNPLGALLSLAGPIMSSMGSATPNFSGVGDFSGGGLVAPSDFSYPMSTSQSWLNTLDSGSLLGSALGQTPAGFADMLSSAAPMSTTAGWLNATTTSFPGITSGAAGTNSLLDNKLVQQAAKGALKLGAKGLMSEGGAPDGQDRLAALRSAQEKQKGEAPMLQQPQGMAPAATPAAAASEERWRRLRYGNEPVLEGNVVPQ